jgi:hypothetical protein
MKFKQVKQKSDNSLLLRANLEKKDIFNYVIAKRLATNKLSGLIPFSFTEEKATPELFYNITNLASLKTLLGAKLSLPQFHLLLRQIVELLEALGQEGMPERNIIFESNRVYASMDSLTLLFLYLPLDNQPVNGRAILDLLLFLAGNARFVDEGGKAYSDTLLDFLKRQRVFSLVDLKAHLGLSAHAGVDSGSLVSSGGSPEARNVLPVARPKQRAMRDFVTEGSGVKTKKQHYEAQSTTENILSAVSGDLDTTSAPLTFSHNTQAPKQPNKLTLQEPHRSSRYILKRMQDDKQWPLALPSILIGRSKSAQLQVSESDSVSRQHAILHLENETILLEDNDSSNGTFVNSGKLQPKIKTEIRAGDIITLGNQDFQLVDLR